VRRHAGAASHAYTRARASPLCGRIHAGHVAVLGTGRFGTALACRLAGIGYNVVIGSRSPERHHVVPTTKKWARNGWPQDEGAAAATPLMLNVNSFAADADASAAPVVATMAAAVQDARIVFACVPGEAVEATLLPLAAALQRGCVVVDVSNNDSGLAPTVIDGRELSRIEALAARLRPLAPHVQLVKALNTISAYTLADPSLSHGVTAPLCGDDVAAKRCVSQLIMDLGMVPLDLGRLRTSAVALEALPFRLFPKWTTALLIGAVVFVLLGVYALLRYNVFKGFAWANLTLQVLNKVFGSVALTLFALSTLAGVCAALLQLWRGTVDRPFPRLLAAWLDARKQLGLVAVAFLAVHVPASLVIASPAYIDKFYRDSSDPDQDLVLAKMNAMGEASILAGILAYVLVLVLAVTSLPTVARALSWREWNVVHTYMAWLALALATGHVVIMGAYDWVRPWTWPAGLPPVTLLVCIVPVVTVSAKLVLLLPPCSRWLRRLRTGDMGDKGGKAI